jgi:protein-L-isoaspartate O-methyltransferase
MLVSGTVFCQNKDAYESVRNSMVDDQLAEGGRLVMPVGDPATVQQLIVLTNRKGKITEQRLEPVRFVPLKRLN